MRQCFAWGVGCVILAIAALPVSADPVSDFYRVRNVTIVIGYSVGGGYDNYARVLARHMGRHIPGNPNFVPQNMPGAGSLRAVNYLYGVAPKDGTAIAHFAPGIMFEPLLGRPSAAAAQFEANKFTWLRTGAKPASV